MPTRWYQEDGGLRFTCKGRECGDCCSGRWGPGHVWVSVEEMRRIAAAMELPFDAFTRAYVRQVGMRYSLTETPRGDCVFYEEGAGCRVYGARPDMCRAYPFWPQVVQSRATWEAEAAHCPGIGQGETVRTSDEIDVLLPLRRA